MEFFKLPQSTKVGRSIPKNAFNPHTDSKQRKLLSDKIGKITWNNKLSTSTINLPFFEVSEIQIFRIDLKSRENLMTIVDIIDKSIPYHIIFLLVYQNLVQVSVSLKHINLNNSTNVIDWRFSSDWLVLENFHFELSLKRNLDYILKDLCFQISGQTDLNIEITDLIEFHKQKLKLEKEILLIEAKIKKVKQFNLKVELNLALLELKERLEHLTY